MEAVLTTWPKPCSIIRGQAAWTPWTTPIRLTSTASPPVLERQVADLAAHGDPGVVEEVVEAAVAGEDVRDERVHRGGVAHVEGRALGLPARGRDPGGLGPGVLPVAVGEDHERAPARQLAAEGGADPRGTARHQGDRASEGAQGRLLAARAGHERLSPWPAAPRTAPSRTRPPCG